MIHNLENILEIKKKLSGLSSEDPEAFKTEYRKFLIDRPFEFNQLYRSLVMTKAEPIRELFQFEGETLLELIRVSKELKCKGISVWPNFYPPSKLSELYLATQTCLDASKKWLKTAPLENTQWHDTELDCEHWGHRNSPLIGRTRSFFRNKKGFNSQFSIINELMTDKRLLEVGRRLYKAHSFLVGFLAEELVPAKIADYWHIDGILDQYKAMILLKDVGEDQGPMFFKPNTKKHLSDKLNPMLHSTFAYGRAWGNYPYYRIVDSLEIETYKATGKAGDAIFLTPCTFTEVPFVLMEIG